jgi:hypothetical protein
VLFSADQELSEGLGVWTRLGRQNDAATVNYDRLYSGGLQLSGRHRGRPDDAFAVGRRGPASATQRATSALQATTGTSSV